VNDKGLQARLACGCQLGFRDGVEGSPVTVVVLRKADGCQISVHVGGVPLFDHREALRPATRPVAHPQPDYEEN
jgi:hypothetical protein